LTFREKRILKLVIIIFNFYCEYRVTDSIKNTKIDVKVKVQYLSCRVHRHSLFTKELNKKGATRPLRVPLRKKLDKIYHKLRFD